MRTSVSLRALTVVAALAALPVVLRATVPGGISLRLTTETAPPGGIAQLKLEITEPKPITTGFARFNTGGLGIEGIAVMSSADDTLGVAVVDGANVALSVLSPSATLGLDEYPILTMAVRIPVTTPFGTRFNITGDLASMAMVDPSGQVYVAELKNGSITASRGISVDDVIPGSADLPAGSLVSLVGTGFTPDTAVRLKGTSLAMARYVSPSLIETVLASPASMHGLTVRIEDNDARNEYLSYQR